MAAVSNLVALCALVALASAPCNAHHNQLGVQLGQIGQLGQLGQLSSHLQLGGGLAHLRQGRNGANPPPQVASCGENNGFCPETTGCRLIGGQPICLPKNVRETDSNACERSLCPANTVCVQPARQPASCRPLPVANKDACSRAKCSQNQVCKNKHSSGGTVCVARRQVKKTVRSQQNSCATAKCAKGTTCRVVNNVAKCEPAAPTGCSLVRCGGGAPHCVEFNGRARCVVLAQSKIPCSLGKCAPNSTCKAVGNKATCVPNKSAPVPCPAACARIFMPQCGSDGKTYGNTCELNVANCRSNGAVTLKHAGACGSDSTTKKCPEMCPMLFQPTCGSDGKTYGNKCLLDIAACKSNGAISMKNAGPCETNKCPQIKCDSKEAPVCANDGKTYRNSCFVKVASCEFPQLHVAYQGACHAPCLG